MFKMLYEWTIRWSGHHLAPLILGVIAFIESSFFPIPPDVMLISMGLAKPNSAWRNACIASVFSVLGGMFGYAIGYYLFDIIGPWLTHSAWNTPYQTAIHWFKIYGVWAVIIAGFTPIPYKLFTIGAGAVHMPFLPFVLGSIIGRSMRFFLVSMLFYFYGAKLQEQMLKVVNKLAWLLLLLLGALYGTYKIFA